MKRKDFVIFLLTYSGHFAVDLQETFFHSKTFRRSALRFLWDDSITCSSHYVALETKTRREYQCRMEKWFYQYITCPLSLR